MNNEVSPRKVLLWYFMRSLAASERSRYVFDYGFLIVKANHSLRTLTWALLSFGFDAGSGRAVFLLASSASPGGRGVAARSGAHLVVSPALV